MSESLTLAVPYYSGFALFEQTLRSLAAQTHADCRVLVVDDSRDGFRVDELQRVQQALAGRFPLRVLRNQSNLGMARSWNRCLDDADTDLVTIVHGDDLLSEAYASEMVALAGRFAVPALFCGARVIGASGKDVFSLPDLVKRALIPRHQGALQLRGDQALASLLRGNYIFCPSLCYRRSRLKLRFDPRWRFVLDMDLTVRLLLSGSELVGIPERPLYHYRRHAQNATARMTAELTRFQEESAFYGDVAARAAALGLPRAARTARGQRIIQLNLAFCIARDLAARNFRDGSEKLQLFLRLFARRRVS